MVNLYYAMVQSINTKALLTLASVVRRPYLASPHVHVPSISDVNYQSMRDHCGIRAIIFDKDNTLTAPYERTIHERAALGLKNALDVFGHENVAILSNSAGTLDDDEYEDAIQIERELGINVIRHDEKKPGGLEEVLHHFSGNYEGGSDGCSDGGDGDGDGDGDGGTRTRTTRTPITASELCMVGDRLLTDVVFGNLHGMLTVHCLPLCTGRENRGDNAIASMVRTMENKFMYGSTLGSMTRKRTIPHSKWVGEDDCPLILVHGSESSGSSGSGSTQIEPGPEPGVGPSLT